MATSDHSLRYFLRVLRRFRDELIYFFLKPFGPAFCNRHFPAVLLMKHVFIQKFLRVNAHVPWPVHWTSQVNSVEKIARGSRCPGLSRGCHIDGRNGIKIGKNVWIGPKVSIISMNHDVTNYHHFINDPAITIGDNCWLGAHCLILPGVRLGNHIVVAAGTVVTKSFEEDNLLLAGVPARIIKKLSPYQGDKK